MLGATTAAITSWWGALQLLDIANPPHVAILVGCGVVLTGAGGLAGYWAAPEPPRPLIEQLRADPKWRAEQRKRLEQEVSDLLSFTLSLHATAPRDTGAIVYFPDASGRLRAKFAYNKPQAVDELDPFEKWQGCTGMAWGYGEQRVADLTAATPEVLRANWHMTPEQIEATGSLKVVVSTPIWSRDNPQFLLGVVSFDSSVPAARSGLTTEAALTAATKCANLLARVLARSPLSLADLA